MKAMKISASGATWKLDRPDAVRAWYFSLPAIARPLFAIGCERCKMVCVIRVSDCTCCVHYGKRTAGGTKYFPTISGGPGLFNYDPDAPAHKALMPFSELVQLIAKASAVFESSHAE